jgi:Ca2+-binding RTX toxin-like protein
MDLKLTAGNDTYDQAREDTEWRDYYGLEGDDFISVYLGNLVGGPGNDRLVHLPGVSWGRVGAAYWDATKPITADLEAGYAEDGMGGRDILINIDAVLAPWNGGTMYGNALYNDFHLGGGGRNVVDGRGGDDKVFLPNYDNNSTFADFDIRVSIDGLTADITSARNPNFSAHLLNIESLGMYTQGGEIGASLGGFIRPVDMAVQAIAGEGALRWNAGSALGTATALTYSFVDSAPGVAGFRPFSAEERATVRAILDAAAAATGLSFTEAAGSSGQLRFGASQQADTRGTSMPPGSGADAGAVWIDLETMAALKPGQEGLAILLHETGHALGLRHTRNSEPDDHYDKQLRPADDSMALSVMSLAASHDGLFPATWSAYDIHALRYLYGTRSTHAGDDIYRLDAARFSAETALVDDGGNDTIDASAAMAGAAIDLTPGHLSSAGVTPGGVVALDNLSLGLDSWIENAIGSDYDDVLTGNLRDNLLAGGKGNDWIDGGAGRDVAQFGGVRADYAVSTGFGKVFVSARDGSSGFDTLLGIEVLRFADGDVALAAVAQGADLSASLDQDTTLAGSLPVTSDTAASGLRYALLKGPANGKATVGADGQYSYTPNAGFAGTDYFSYTLGNDKGSNTYYAYFSMLPAGSLHQGGSGPDVLAGLSGNDTISGFGGDDRIIGSAGNDAIDGGAGLDSLVFDALRAGYVPTQAGAKWTLSKQYGDGGSDTLAGVERLLFQDGALALDPLAAQAYRLYQAAFGRQPDEGGLGFWLAQLDKGMSMATVAQAFLSSAESLTLYGANPSNQQLVTTIYQNVLHRAPDQAGLDFWVKAMNAGYARDQVLLGFSESGENQAQVAATIAHGVPYQPFI